MSHIDRFGIRNCAIVIRDREDFYFNNFQAGDILLLHNDDNSLAPSWRKTGEVKLKTGDVYASNPLGPVMYYYLGAYMETEIDDLDDMPPSPNWMNFDDFASLTMTERVKWLNWANESPGLAAIAAAAPNVELPYDCYLPELTPEDGKRALDITKRFLEGGRGND